MLEVYLSLYQHIKSLETERVSIPGKAGGVKCSQSVILLLLSSQQDFTGMLSLFKQKQAPKSKLHQEVHGMDSQ